MSENKKSQNEWWISFLRITATLGVIWLHICGYLVGNKDLFQMSKFQIIFFTIAQYMMIWTVPIFFMITGALLLDKRKMLSVRDCIFKYAKRITIAILLFGTFYSTLLIYKREGSISIMMLPKAIKGMLTGDTFSHMWYCYVLVGIYLVFPILKIFVNHSDQKTQRYILIVLFVFDFMPTLINYLTGLTIAFTIPVSYPLFYILLGYYLKTYKPRNKWIKIFWCCSFFITVFYAINMAIGKNTSLDYNTPATAIFSFPIFNWYLQKGTKLDASINHMTEWKRKFIWEIDRECFGVYLIHQFYITLFYKVLGITPITFAIWPFGLIIIFFTISIISFLTTYILRKIPIINKYVL